MRGEKKTKTKTGCLCKETHTMKTHKGPQTLCSVQPPQTGRKNFFFCHKSQQFPKTRTKQRQLRKKRGKVKGSSSTQQHRRGDLQGLTNPHILQQQHPLGALEPLCILVNHTPRHHTSTLLEAAAAAAALLT